MVSVPKTFLEPSAAIPNQNNSHGATWYPMASQILPAFLPILLISRED